MDSVKVHDGADVSTTVLGKFCGSTLPHDIFSSSNSLFVSFKSDAGLTGNGFSIKYTTIVRGKCLALYSKI